MICQRVPFLQTQPIKARGFVDLYYDPARPFEVAFMFDTSDGFREWLVARDLLAEAFRHGCAGLGDVRFWRFGRQVLMKLSGEDGTATLLLSADDVRRFLDQTYRVVPRGREVVDVDYAIAELFDGAE